MGLLGALKGIGDASASIGQTGVNYAFQKQRDESEELRQRAIAKYSQELSDESWAARNEITNKKEIEKATAAATAAEKAKSDDRNYQSGMELYKTNAELNKMAAENQYRSKEQEAKLAGEKELEGIKQTGAETLEGIKQDSTKNKEWKQDEVEKHAAHLVAKGMGLDSNSMTNYDANLQKDYAEKVSKVVSEYNRDPSSGVSGAYDRVVNTKPKTVDDFIGEAIPSKKEADTGNQKPTQPEKKPPGLLNINNEDPERIVKQIVKNNEIIISNEDAEKLRPLKQQADALNRVRNALNNNMTLSPNDIIAAWPMISGSNEFTEEQKAMLAKKMSAR